MTNKKRKKKQKSTITPEGKIYTGSLPPKFTFKLAANFGTEEPFVVRIQIQLKDILKSMELANADEADFRLDRIIEQLDIARIHLLRIENKNFTQQPTFDQQAEYVAFYNSIWWAYKDRFQFFMKELGFDIGFIFQNDKNFEAGANTFLKDHPDTDEFITVTRNDRQGWQNVLAIHRNALHSGDRRGEKHDLDNPKDARVMFDNVWQAIEEHTVYLGEKVMARGWTIVQIPEEQKDKVIPVRFKPYLKGLLDGSIKLPTLDSASSQSDDQTS